MWCLSSSEAVKWHPQYRAWRAWGAATAKHDSARELGLLVQFHVSPGTSRSKRKAVRWEGVEVWVPLHRISLGAASSFVEAEKLFWKKPAGTSAGLSVGTDARCRARQCRASEEADAPDGDFLQRGGLLRAHRAQPVALAALRQGRCPGRAVGSEALRPQGESVSRRVVAAFWSDSVWTLRSRFATAASQDRRWFFRACWTHKLPLRFHVILNHLHFVILAV